MEEAVEGAEIVPLVAPGPSPWDISAYMARWASTMIHPSRDRDARAAIMVILTDDAPLVAHIGMRGWDDYRECDAVLSDLHINARWDREEDEDLNDYIARRWASRIECRRQNDEAAAAKRAAVPWSCEFCGHRYKTERGCVKHEQQYCRSNPKSAFFASGDYVPLHVKDGKAHGYAMTDQGRRKHDAEMRRRGYKVL